MVEEDMGVESALQEPSSDARLLNKGRLPMVSGWIEGHRLTGNWVCGQTTGGYDSRSCRRLLMLAAEITLCGDAAANARRGQETKSANRYEGA